jgi:hypothetical protein
MKYVKAIQQGIAVILFITSMSCAKEGDYNLEKTPPLDFRSYYNGLLVTFANATQGASGISWNFGDGSAEVSGDSVDHQFNETGNYVITMNGTYEGVAYTFHTILRVDKPSVIKLTDNSFDDWKQVDYPDFQLDGQEKILKGEVDYDANYVYFYIEYLTTGSDGKADLDKAVMDIYMDVDNTLSSGYSASIGAELLYEGNIPSSWFDFYRFSGAAQSDWAWTVFTADNAIKLGNTAVAEDTARMEFGISREAFGINKDAFAFRVDLYYEAWSATIGSLEKDNQTRIEMAMNKE